MRIVKTKLNTDQNVYCTSCPKHCYLYTLSLADTNEVFDYIVSDELEIKNDCPTEEGK